MNLGSFKINRISLLNQSGFNNSLKKVLIPKSKLSILKEISVNKNSEKPFDIYFTPMDNINANIKIKKDNNYKTNPLSEKNKIIRKHNILQKIDFNTNTIKNNTNKSNNKIELNLCNNNIIINTNNNKNNHNNNSKYNNNLNAYGNKSNSLNMIYNENITSLPLLTNTNRESNKTSKKSINNLYKNTNVSSSYNNFLNFDTSSTPVKFLKNMKKHKSIFSNEKIKKTYEEIIKSSKPNCSEKEIQTNEELSTNNKDKSENNNKCMNIKIKNKENKSNEDNEESSSNDFDDMKEIEKIISKSTRNILTKNINNDNNRYYHRNNLHRIGSYFNSPNNSENEADEKNEYILLKNLYKVKNNKIKKNKIVNQNKTTHYIFLNTENNINRNTHKETRNKHYLNKYINCFNRSNKENNNLKNKKKINNKDDLMSYNYKRKFIEKKKIYNLLDSSNISNIKNSIHKNSY